MSKYLILEIQNGRTRDAHYIYKRPEIGETINRTLDETYHMFLERVMKIMHDEHGYNYHSNIETSLVFELADQRRGKV